MIFTFGSASICPTFQLNSFGLFALRYIINQQSKESRRAYEKNVPGVHTCTLFLRQRAEKINKWRKQSAGITND
jgi:hypothetical protein